MTQKEAKILDEALRIGFEEVAPKFEGGAPRFRFKGILTAHRLVEITNMPYYMELVKESGRLDFMDGQHVLTTHPKNKSFYENGGFTAYLQSQQSATRQQAEIDQEITEERQSNIKRNLSIIETNRFGIWSIVINLVLVVINLLIATGKIKF